VEKDLIYYENLHNNKYPEKPIKVTHIKNKDVYFETEFGLCKMLKNSLKRGSYKIYSAVDKTDYLKKYIIKKWGNNYDLSKVEYSGKPLTKIILICKKHGEFTVNLQNYLKRGNDCFLCKQEENKTNNILEKTFIHKANIVHKNKYDYSNIIYNLSFSKIKVICPVHGEFEQSPYHHLEGSGCQKCGNLIVSSIRGKEPTGWNTTSWINSANKSKNFDSFKVYVIKCWNDEETFYKIGRTFLTVQKRFMSKKQMPYNYEVIQTIKGEAKEIFKLESKLKKENEKNKYKPKKDFNGKYECFKKIKKIKNGTTI